MECPNDEKKRILGIIVEYNPFHKGHLFHLKESVSKSGADGVVAVMSGNFVQRGEPAIMDKFDRAEIAVKSGVNLVLELPSVYAVQDAGGFACGAVGILERSGIVTDLIFGSESSEIGTLVMAADIMVNRKDELKAKERKYMKMGFSYPNARKFALKEMLIPVSSSSAANVENTVSKSNDILGLEYLRWLLNYSSNIKYDTIGRVGASYNDEHFKGEFSSATAIRKMALENDWDKLCQAVPDITCLKMKEYRESGGFFVPEDLSDFFFIFLLARNRDHLKRYYGITEGIEKRFSDSVGGHDSVEEILESVKSKRVTFSRLKRTLLYMLFEIEERTIKNSEFFGPQYIRVLGFDSKGRELLSSLKKAAGIPVISTPSAYNKVLKKYLKKFEGQAPDFFKESVFREHMEIDFRMSDFYYRMKEKKHGLRYCSEIKKPPIIIDER